MEGTSEILIEMRDLEMESEGNLPTPPPTPTTITTPPNTTAFSANTTDILIEGLNPPPTNARPMQPRPVPRQTTRITNHPTRRPPYTARRCLLHLVHHCPVCYRNRRANDRLFRQEGIRAILNLIRDVFGVQLNPRELSLFIAG